MQEELLQFKIQKEGMKRVRDDGFNNSNNSQFRLPFVSPRPPESSSYVEPNVQVNEGVGEVAGGINEVYREVAALFDGQPDLLDEFTRFLLDASAAASAHRAS
nr:paired amphipathic helix protein Sin3-like 2 isoform X1 [Tanacetum cinerariifolium]